MTRIGQFATIITTPCLDREFIARGDYSRTSDEKHVRAVLRQQVERYISEVEASGLHVASIRPLPLSKDELLKRDRQDPVFSTSTLGIPSTTRTMPQGSLADMSVYYDGGCLIYYSALVTLAKGPKPMCDMCGTGTGPCKEEPTSNVAVDALLSKMRRLSDNLQDTEQELNALARSLRDLE